MCQFGEGETISLVAISQKVSKFKMMGIINAKKSSRGRGGPTNEIVFIGDPDQLAKAIYQDGPFVKFLMYKPNLKKIFSVQVW